VLDAALVLASEGGVDALSMREVARRAGVSHQAPYHHFGDREGILAALVAEGLDLFARALEAAGGRAPPADLAAVGLAYVRFAHAHPAHFRLLFRPDLVAPAAHPDLEAAGRRAFLPLASLVDTLVAEGRVAPDDRETVLAAAWSLVHGLALLSLDGPLRGAEADRTAERVTRWFAGLVSARPPGP
jgi:AcrR family transcriptional regulator